MGSRRFSRGTLYAAALTLGVASAELRARVPAELALSTGHAMNVVSPLEVARASAPEVQPLHEPSPKARSAPLAELSTSYAHGRIIEGGTPRRLILFSFDDGPDRRTTPLLLDRLDAVGIKAVFFLTAGRIASRTPAEREQAELAREIVARGHLVGSHTVDHLQLPLLTDASAIAQVDGAEQIFQRVLGFRPSLIRPPGGARSPRIDTLLAERGYTTVLWNLGAGDFQVKTAGEVLETFRRVLERREREHAEHGGIVLLHDTYAWSVDAFQLIYAELWARNCKLLEQGEELYDIVNDPSFFFEPREGAAPGTLATPAQLPQAVFEERQARLRSETAQRCSSTDGF
ncbi:MAG TPA: polysaccharide deacetylase family protein [Polyangiales bacterium]|nr:polysaccharide deacetylase family protein [Polyangiales bacterium]